MDQRGFSDKVMGALYEALVFGAQMTVSAVAVCIRVGRKDVPRIVRAIQHEVHMVYQRKFEAECRRIQRLRRAGVI